MAQVYITYACKWCGIKSGKWQENGRPDPGHCPKKYPGPHSWIIVNKETKYKG